MTQFSTTQSVNISIFTVRYYAKYIYYAVESVSGEDEANPVVFKATEREKYAILPAWVFPRWSRKK